MSLSSARRARRAGAERVVGRGEEAAAGGGSQAARSNSERARTGFTSQLKTLERRLPEGLPFGRREQKQAALDPGRARRLRQAIASGPSAQSTMTRSEAGARLNALRPELAPSARSTLTPASVRRAAIAKGIGDDEGARPVKDLRPRVCGPGRLESGAFRQVDGERKDRPSARIVGDCKLAAH
jgi:hypothetical protein